MLRPIRNAIAAAIFAGLAAGTATAVSAQPLQTIVEGWFAQLNATPDTVADYEGLTVTGDTVVVTGVTIVNRASDNGIAIDTITLSGYRPLAPTGYALDELTIDRLQGRADDAAIQIVDFRMTDLEVPRTGFLFDAAKPFTSIVDLYALAAEINLAEALIGRIDIHQSAGGLDTLVSYHNYRITGVADGRIEATTAGPLVLEAPSPDGFLVITIGELVTEDIDLGAFVQAFDAAQYVNGVASDEWRALVGHAVYRDILVDAPGAQMRIRAIELDDFALRQPHEPIATLLDNLLGVTELAPRELDAITETLIVDLLSPWGIGRFSIQGFDLFADGVDRFHIGEVHILDLSLDGLGEFGFTDLDVVIGGEGWVRIDQFAFGGIEFIDQEELRVMLAAAAAGGPPFDAAALVPVVGYIEIAGVEFGQPRQVPITLDRASIRVGGFVGLLPTDYVFEIVGFGAPLTLLPEEPRRILNELGYTEAKADFGFQLTWNEATETLAFTNLHLALKGAGSIRADFEIVGITRAMFADLEGLENVDPDQLRFGGARILVTDETLAERLFRWTAEGTNTPAEQYRDEFIRGLPFLLSVLMDRSIAAEIAPALQQFLRVPGTLSIVARPAAPVPLGIIGDTLGEAPMDLLRLLGIEITTAPPAN